MKPFKFEVIIETDEADAEELEESIAELQNLLNTWADKHVNLKRYSAMVGKSRQCAITADDAIYYWSDSTAHDRRNATPDRH
jgi:hypothetical protein